jgi:serine phosphatase RsbU (regulator of sigma subunit)
MQKNIIPNILFSILLLTSCADSVKNPKAVNGNLDLSSWDSGKNGTIKLDGEWEFYWNKLLNSKDFWDAVSYSRNYIKIPGSWNGQSYSGEKLPRFGYATYRLKITNSPKGHLFLYCTAPNAASVFIVNGKIIAEYGKVSMDTLSEQAAIGKRIMEFDNDRDEIEIIVHVSNYHKFASGMTHSVNLGSRENIYVLKHHSVSLDVFIFAILLLISFYHFSQFLFRRKEKASFCFSVFSLVFAVRTITTNEIVITDMLPSINWEIVFRMDFLTIAFIAPLFVKFISCLYPRQMSLIVNKFFYGIAVLYSAMIIFLPTHVFAGFLVYYHLVMLSAGLYLFYVFISAMLDKQPGAVMSIAGFIIVFITGVVDILIANEVINLFFISPFGILAFFLMQTLNLSSRFSKAYERVEQFSEILEEEVRSRTAELQIEKNLLHESNQNYEKELNLAKRIQKQLIPQHSPVAYISFLYKPMEEVGGDFIEFLHFRDSDKIGIFISDVSGHGVPAAFITSMIKTTLLQSGILKENPAALLLHLNEMLLHYTADNFVTAMYSIYDPVNKTVVYASAGHNPPYLISVSDSKMLPVNKSIPLAIMNKSYLEKYNKMFSNNEISLSGYRKLIFYTDGLTETTPINEPADFFEYHGLMDLMQRNHALPCTKFIQTVHNGLLNYRGSENFNDDICLICIDL